MKKIIDGLRYDTDNAIEIGYYSTGGSTSDFTHWEASLYKTPRSGKFFLAGEGGPMTQFASRGSQEGIGYGEKLSPMSREEALSWAEQYLNAEVIEKHFGDSIQDA